jgi:hypothetical protein
VAGLLVALGLLGIGGYVATHALNRDPEPSRNFRRIDWTHAAPIWCAKEARDFGGLADRRDTPTPDQAGKDRTPHRG